MGGPDPFTAVKVQFRSPAQVGKRIIAVVNQKPVWRCMGRALNLIDPFGRPSVSSASVTQIELRIFGIQSSSSPSVLFVASSVCSRVSFQVDTYCVGVLFSCHFHSRQSGRLGWECLKQEPRWVHGCNTVERAQLSCVETLANRKNNQSFYDAFCGNVVHMNVPKIIPHMVRVQLLSNDVRRCRWECLTAQVSKPARSTLKTHIWYSWRRCRHGDVDCKVFSKVYWKPFVRVKDVAQSQWYHQGRKL